MRRPFAILAMIGAISVAACRSSTYSVALTFESGSLRARAVSAEVYLLASCDGIVQPDEPPAARVLGVGTVRFRGSTPVGRSPPGRYVLYARVHDETCLVFASGCSAPFDLVRGGSGELVVPVEPHCTAACMEVSDPTRCMNSCGPYCPGEQVCSARACAPSRDAGDPPGDDAVGPGDDVVDEDSGPIDVVDSASDGATDGADDLEDVADDVPDVADDLADDVSGVDTGEFPDAALDAD